MTAFERVAVIGIAARFPGAPTVATFWRNVRAGVESITRFSNDDLRGHVPEPELSDLGYVHAKGYLDGWDRFDYAFFGYSATEAALMDPQLRLLHECVWEAVEDAGYQPDGRLGAVGVYIGGGASADWLRAAQRRSTTPAGRYHATVLNDSHALSTRLSYKFGFEGPSVTLHTACSSSLVAVHAACRALIAGECRMAVAGGVSILFPVKSGYVHEAGMITSPDGHCRAFDGEAQGTVPGDGCGVVVLKALDAAIADGDRIYAVVPGSAVNNDGAHKLGYTAPAIDAQIDVVSRAHRVARVTADTIGFVEAHGTGTPVGDPIEVEALRRAFGSSQRNRCALGSVKTNVGHLNHAAGIAGFIKAVLAVRDGVIPPTLHYRAANPEIRFQDTPFFVNDTLRDWADAPRRAGVSSFGIGGTNAHVVVEQPPHAATRSDSALTPHVVVLSADDAAALESAVDRLIAQVKDRPGLDLGDAAYTLQTGRSPRPYRRACVCRDRSDILAMLDDRSCLSEPAGATMPVALLFPGPGSQWMGMGAALSAALPAYRRALERCLDALSGDSRAGVETWLGLRQAPDAEALRRPASVHAAIFACGFACAAALHELGVRPAALLGQDLGEFTAACVSGVFTPEDAMKLVAMRAQLAHGAEDAFERAVAATRRSRPQIPFVSNVTGTWVTEEQADEPSYWSRQLRSLVPFDACLSTLLARGSYELLEAGPGGSLAALVGARAGSPPGVVSLLGRDPREDECAVFLRAIAGLWTRGHDIAWPALHEGRVRHRVGLPGYPFRSVALPDLTVPEPAAATQETGCYIPVWERTSPRARAAEPASVLLFAPAPLARDLVEAYADRGRELIAVQPSSHVGVLGPRLYGIRPDHPADYARLFALLAEAGLTPARVVHAWSLGSDWPAGPAESRLNAALDAVLHSTLLLAQALEALSGSAAMPMCIVTCDAVRAPRTRSVDPFQSPVIGLSAVITQESTRVRCVHVDVSSEDRRREGDGAVLAEAIDAFLSDPSRADVALRGADAWTPAAAPLVLPDGGGPPLRRGSTILITGGFGRLGLLAAEHFFRVADVRSVLLGRTLPDATRHAARHRRLARLTQAGAVFPVEGDCASRPDLDRALRAARAWGGICGVIHAAAETRGASISTPFARLDRAACEEQIAPKARGLLALRDAIEAEDVEFVLVCSSLASWLGGPGLAAYAAANRFVDACVESWSAAAGTRWVSVNWDGWRDPDDEAQVDAARRSELIAVDDGLSICSRILASSGPDRILVARGDLVQRQRRWVDRPAARPASIAAPACHRAGGGSVERTVVEVWQRFFGADELGPESDFFELGGDSLRAITLASTLEAAFGVRVDVRDVLAAPTIAQCARLVAAARAARSRRTITATEPASTYPLSFAQESVLAPRNQTYPLRFNCSVALETGEALDAVRLEEACRAVIRRHDVLRTWFDPARSRQHVEPAVAFALASRVCDRAEADARTGEFVRPFDLARPPLLRAELLYIAGAGSRLLLDVHHAITDAVSLDAMLAEIGDAYTGRATPPHQLQYRDYVLWQRDLDASGAFDEDAQFWRDALDGCTWTALPSAACNGPASFDRLDVVVDRGVHDELIAICRAHRVTMATLLVAAVSSAVWKCTGQRDVTLGLRRSCRTEPALARMLGVFVDDVACRLRMPDGDASALLRAAASAVAAARDRGGHPYERLNAEMQAQRPTPNGELFTILVNHLPPVGERRHALGSVKLLPRAPETKYFVNLRLREGAALTLDAKYRADKYSRRFMRAFLDSVVAEARAMSAQLV